MLRFGLFGCGRIGRVHADSIAANPRAGLAVAYDPFESSAGAANPRAGLAVAYDPFESSAAEVAGLYGATPSTDPEAVLADPSIDAVVIASPTSTHVDLLSRAAKAGKAILCEKPIDLAIVRVDECWRQIQGTGVPISSGSTGGSIPRSGTCTTGCGRARSAGWNS